MGQFFFVFLLCFFWTAVLYGTVLYRRGAELMRQICEENGTNF